MDYQALIFKQEGGIGIITLNRPERRNALNTVLVRELSGLLDEIAKNEDIKVVVLTGGNKFFCVGVDLKEQSPTVMDELRGMLLKLDNLDRPTIAAINGSCLAGGLEMAISCDLRVAAEDAMFGVPEIRFGMLATAGGTQRLPRLIGRPRAKEMHYTGEPIDAHEAYQLGLLNRVVPPPSVLDEAMKLARTIVERPLYALRTAKLLIDCGMTMDLNTALKFETETAKVLMSNIERLQAEMSKAANQGGVYKKLFG